MKDLFRISQAPDGSFVVFAGNSNEIVAARTDYRDLIECVKEFVRPADEPRTLRHDPLPDGIKPEPQADPGNVRSIGGRLARAVGVGS